MLFLSPIPGGSKTIRKRDPDLNFVSGGSEVEPGSPVPDGVRSDLGRLSAKNIMQ